MAYGFAGRRTFRALEGKEVLNGTLAFDLNSRTRDE